MEYSRKQIAESVKNKYPEYASIDNDQLADSILKKYPQYKTKLDDGSLLESAKQLTQVALSGFSDAGYATLEGVASGISRLTGDSDLVKTVSDFRNYSKEFYEGSVPDEDKSKFGYKAVRTIAQTPAYMAAAATGPIGLAALTANAYQQGRDDYLSTQGVTSVSASEDQLKESDKVGAFSAVPIVVLERFGATRLVDNIFRGQSKVTIREAGKRIASSAVGEGLTEGSQTIFQNTLASELMKYDPEREITEGVFESILLGAVAGGTVTSPVVGYQAFQDRNLSPSEQAVEQGVGPDTALTYTVSYVNPKNDEQSILNIQAANPEEAIRLATQGLGNRAVNIKYEGINTSDFKVEEEVTPDPVVEEAVTPEPEPAPVQEVDLEAVKEQQDTIDDSDSRIADLQSEIVIEKDNIKEVRARNKQEISAVRKSKIPKEEKSEKIEDLKASLQDEVDDMNGNIGIYKEEMSSFKKDLRKAKKKLAGLQPSDVVAEAAPVTGKPESVKLTQKETEFFNELLGNEANRAELIEEVPSLNIVDGKLSIEPTDIQNLNNFISDVAISDGLGTVPTRLKTNKFYEPFFKEEPEVTAGAAPVGTPQTFQQPLPTGELPTSINVKESNEISLDSRPTYDRVQAVKSTVTKAGKPAKGYYEKLGDLVSTYDFFPEGSKRGSTKDKVDEFVDFVERNVLYLYDTMDSTIRERTKLWYDGANHIAQGFSAKYGISQDEASGVLAVLSPQKDWFQNVSLAERVLDSWYNRDSIPAWSSEMDTTAARIWKAKDNLLIDSIRGKKLSELSDPAEQAAWTRTYDETFNSREFAVITPEGGILPPSGKKVGWGSTDEIAKTFKILNNLGDMKALSAALGKMHKVRNFYNNIAYPNSANGYATMDTHAIAAGMFFPVGGNNPITSAGLGGSPVSGPNGLYGTYPLFLEGYTRAANKRGVQPREMQSITWEQIRTLFTNKSKPKLDFASKTWESYSKGDTTYEEAIQKIITNHEGFGKPTWVESSAGLDVFLGNPTYQGPLSSTGISGPELQVGTAGSGRTSRTSRDVQAGPEVTAQAAPVDGQGQPTPSQAESSRIQKFVEDNFGGIAQKIGFPIESNTSIDRTARYNSTKGVLELNPDKVVELQAAGQIDIVNDGYLRAVMREEIIHGAISKVTLQQSKGNDEGQALVDFMSKVADLLTPDQKAKMQSIYAGLDAQADWQTAAEYTRAAFQEGLYGDITESFISQGPAFNKIKKLIKSVQAYLARTLGSEVKTNPEVAGVIRASAEILQQVDPSARVINQAIVKEAMARSAPVFPNSNYGFAVQGEPFNERKIEVTAFDKYAKTMNALLADIDPSLKGFSNQYYYNIESKSLDRLKAALPFVEKYRGIEKKSKRDFQRLKRLLLFSEVSVSERGQNFIKERDALLKKYGMYNDFQLGPRFILDEILDEGTKSGVEMGKVYDYMPRFINDLEKVKNYYGKSAKTGFREYLKGTKDSEGNVIIKGQNQEIKEARARLDELQEEGKPVPESVRELANKEIIPVLGGQETAYYEAIYFDDYLRQEGFKKPKGATPSSTKERTVGVLEGDLIPSKIIDAYDDIDVALERYIYNMTSSLETLRIIGRRYTYEDTGIKINKNEVPSDLSVLLRELVAANRITEEQAEGIIPDIFQRAVRVRKQEGAPLELLRSLGYISGLVEFTSTLSQLLDTTFVTVKNNPIGTLSAILNNTVTGQMVGIDVEQIASEFVQDKTARTDGSKFSKAANLSNKSLRKLLMTTGFRQLDMRMKNANLTANFNRYRKLTNGYYRDRNSNKSKLFASELSYLGLSPNQQIQFMAELKRFKPGKPNAEQFRNAPLVRQVLFSRLNESQPMSKGSRPLAATENPNAQILYMMKSFMVNQMNNARSEIINRIADPRLSNLERRRAVIDLLRLLAGLVAIGMPVAGLKDFIAGRLGYLNDYLINSLLSPLGISTYTGYKIQREGIFGAVVSYVAPVSLQMAGDMLLVMQRLAMGQKVQPKDITAFLPYSENINRLFGFNTESQLRKYERKKKVGQKPIVIPSDIKLPQRLF